MSAKPKQINGKKSIEQKVALRIYDLFREAHKSVVSIRHEFNLSGIEDCALDAIDSTLYLAEHIIMERMKK